ncbi:MAG: glycosyltransferase family 4 protein [Marmoricola sp.]
MTTLQGKRIVVANWRCPDHSQAGGAERYAWEFSRALVAAGAEVDFLTAREPGQPRRERRDGITLHRGGGRFGYYAYAARFLRAERRRIDAVLDAASGVPEFAPLWVGRRVPVVLLMHHVHQEQFDTHFPPMLAAVGKAIEGRVMPRLYRDSLTLAVSESTRAEMVRRLGWTGPIDVLVNGSDDPLPVAVDPADTVDRVVVLGRLAAHKRVDLVVRAVAALVPNRPTMHLDVLGTGPELERLTRLVDDLGVAKHVTLHGYVDQATKADVLAHARLQVCASDAEGWGQVVIEAAGYGVPTLARNVPGLSGSIRPDETGWLVEEPAEADLITAQARLTVGLDDALTELADDRRRIEMADQCRAWAQTFSWKQMHAGAVRVLAAAIEGEVAK